MTEELIIREIRIDEAADSWMTSFKVIMPLEHQSTMKSLLSDALHCNLGKRMTRLHKGKIMGWSLIKKY